MALRPGQGRNVGELAPEARQTAFLMRKSPRLRRSVCFAQRSQDLRPGINSFAPPGLEGRRLSTFFLEAF
jgi:hypothetical protein